MAQPRVLVVEDNLDDAVLARRAFKKAGLALEVLVLGDAEQAMAYLGGQGEYADRSTHPLPVLMLLDLLLPGRTGHELLAWIRSEPDLMHLRVAMLTNASDRTVIERSEALGANGHLPKPVAVEALHHLVVQLGLQG